MTKNINLKWLVFKVNLVSVDAWVRANTSSGYCGCSADSSGLHLHFTAQPSSQAKAAIQAYWNGLSISSSEATSYQSHAQILAAKAASKASLLASATSKLSALGLTSDEISALIGSQ